jgi:hypothetical protein
LLRTRRNCPGDHFRNHPGQALFTGAGAGEQRSAIASPRANSAQLHPLAWAGIIGAILFALTMVTLLAIQLAVLKDSREHIRSQDAKVTALYNGARDALDDAQPVANQAAPLARQARRTLSAVNASRGPIVDAAIAIPPLLRATGALTDNALPLLALLRDTDLVRKAAAAADLAPSVLAIQQRLLRVQLRTLKTQRASLRTQLATLEIQRQALTHIENIDRKTGGQVPGALP